MLKTCRQPELVIDPEFESYIPALTQEEYEQLEENILCMHRVIDPIIVWEGNIIVDGHNRYRIAKKHPEIIYSTVDLGVDTREEALDWICRMQLGRRNLTPEQRKFLIGKRYGNEKHTHGGDRRSEEARSSGHFDHLESGETVRAKIAREMGTSESYVKRAEQYARGLDLMDEIVPGIRNEILLGTRKIPETEITAITKANDSDRKRFVKALLAGQSVAAEIKKQRSEELAREREEIRRIEEYSAEMERPKDPFFEAEDILYEMNDALETWIFRWDFAFKQPHPVFEEKELQVLKKMLAEGLEFLKETEKKWEAERDARNR